MNKPSTLTQPFWDAAREKKLLLQFDAAAQRWQFYPRPLSLHSTGGKLEWKESAGRGVLIALTTCYAPARGYEGEVPYLVGIVRLDEGPRIFARVVNAKAGKVKVGAKMRVTWQESKPEHLPFQFEPDR